MATQGWYNHYDDPDEFWDEEPLVVGGNPQTGAAPPSVQPPDSPQPQVGSSFVSMDLDGGFLPVRIEFNARWGRYVAPHEACDELMRAYRKSVHLRFERLYSGRRRPTPQEVSVDAVPDRRTMFMVLLETGTWDQYCEVSSSMMSSGATYRIHGTAVTGGVPAVTVTADRMYLKSFEIRSDWIAVAHPDQISDELLRCADQIRLRRPRFGVDRDYSRYSEEDLKFSLDRHRSRLIDEKLG